VERVEEIGEIGWWKRERPWTKVKIIFDDKKSLYALFPTLTGVSPFKGAHWSGEGPVV
jgi:hypothetical protein